MLTYEHLLDICKSLPEDIKAALEPTFRNIEFETKVLDALRNDKRTAGSPGMQKAFRNMSQTFQQDIKLVLWQLRNNESSAADELIAKLAEFQ